MADEIKHVKPHQLNSVFLWEAFGDAEFESRMEALISPRVLDSAGKTGEHTFRFYYASGPLKPEALLAYLRFLTKTSFKLQSPKKLVVLIDGVGHYAPKRWRLYRVLSERRIVGIRKYIFTVSWYLREILISCLKNFRLLYVVDIWYELAVRVGRDNYSHVSGSASTNPKRVWVDQPIIEDFELGDSDIRAYKSLVDSSRVDFYLKHPRSSWMPDGIPTLDGEDWCSCAETKLLSGDYLAVGLFSSVLFNLKMLGYAVEFVELPENIEEVEQHARILKDNDQLRSKALVNRLRMPTIT